MAELKKAFDEYAPDVLEHFKFIEPQARARGARRKWVVKTVLPDKTNYEELKRKRFTCDAGVVLEFAFLTLDTVKKAALDDANTSDSQKKQMLLKVVSLLNLVERPELCTISRLIPVTFIPSIVKESLEAERNEAVSAFRAIMLALTVEKEKTNSPEVQSELAKDAMKVMLVIQQAGAPVFPSAF
jgi:hypothetical protein